MSVITLEQAKKQVRDLQIADADMQLIIDNAESYVEGFLDRAVFVDDAALTAARTAAPLDFVTALADITERMTAAQALEDAEAREVTLDAIALDARANRGRYRRAMAGVVATGRIKAGILLMVGHLYANAEAVVVDTGTQVFELPLGVTNILYPDRLVGV